MAIGAGVLAAEAAGSVAAAGGAAGAVEGAAGAAEGAAGGVEGTGGMAKNLSGGQFGGVTGGKKEGGGDLLSKVNMGMQAAGMIANLAKGQPWQGGNEPSTYGEQDYTS